MESSFLASAESEIVFFLNGVKVVEKNPQPEMTFLYYLRNCLGLPGTKLGCGEGGCGACTVMVSQHFPAAEEGLIRHYSINACLALLCAMDGLAVTTVEGIGSLDRPHPVQERIAKSHGSQCGFCTPGIVMSMYALLRNNPRPSQMELERTFDGNLCRCTGYRPILSGFGTFTKEFCCGGGQCGAKCGKDEDSGVISGPYALFDPEEFRPLDPSQEPIFPPQLQTKDPPKPLFIRGSLKQWSHEGQDRSYQTTWIRPVSLDQIMEAKHVYPKAKIVGGSTEIAVEMKVRGWEYHVFISPLHVREMNQLEQTGGGLSIGASCSVTRVGEKMKELVDQLPAHTTQALQAVLEMLRWFAGDQVRNVATMGGNLVTASPISDLNPILMAVGASVTIGSKTKGVRTAAVDEKFFVSYRKVAMEPDEVLISIFIPFTKQSQHLLAYKKARRREDDIAIVNACFVVELESQTVTNGDDGDNKVAAVVQSARLVYGGRAAVIKAASRTEAAIAGMTWDNALLERAMETIPLDLLAPSDVPGGMPEYRQTLSVSLFYKFYMTVLGRVAAGSLPAAEYNITQPFSYQLTKGCQGFQDVPADQGRDDAVGRPLAHLSAVKQATGTAVYVDDMPRFRDELSCAVVWSARSHATVVGVDAAEARKIPGVWGFLGAADLQEGESNVYEIAGVMDEEVFAENVRSRGQVVGVVLAVDQMTAQLAARRVVVKYQELPSILTIQEAIEAESFYDVKREIRVGKVEEAFARSDHVVEGELNIGGQEQFYMETNSILVVPQEEGELEIFHSTQNAAVTQLKVAMVTGIPSNKIVVRVKRLGGGFGGKETRTTPLACAVAIAAKRSGRPVRCMLDRHEDMMSTGGRHPFHAKYKVGCMKDGRLTSCRIHLYSNGGHTVDLSVGVLDRAVWHVDNCYNVPNWHVVGRVCRTNLPSNTAFRGFGGPQGMLVAEDFITKVAEVCGLPAGEVRRLNLYREGDLTHYKQPLTHCHLRQCWDQLLSQADLQRRRGQLDQFNRESRWVKRGLSVVPTKFGIAFGVLCMNQGGALVHVYTDGQVLLAHGGVEMGQGLHTKMTQVCARVLGVPPSKVFISETSTNTVPNALPTAASFSTDLYGMAVKNACEEIRSRLAPYKEASPNGSWEQWVRQAFLDRVSLSANGFYRSEELTNMDWATGEGCPFSYFTYGVAASEVEVDLLTGDHRVLRTDIVMDVGQSLNPAIDIGQIEGGFAQGYGLFMMEEHVFLDGREAGPRGTMVTTGPGAYKIPGFSDIPLEFNVSLLKGSSNKRAIYSSKAIGEPPLFLASSVFFAVREAITASRKEAGINEPFQLDSPASCERIRLACEDKMARVCSASVQDNGKRWNIGI